MSLSQFRALMDLSSPLVMLDFEGLHFRRNCVTSACSSDRLHIVVLAIMTFTSSTRGIMAKLPPLARTDVSLD